MANARVAPGVHFARAGHDSSSKKLRYGLAGLAIAGVALGAIFGVQFANRHWPYRYRIVKPLLEEVLGSQIVITRYHRTYFPNPGFVAEGITLRRKSAPDLPPLGSVEQLAVQGTWIDLFLLRERVKLVDIQRLHVVVPAPGSRANKEDFPPGSASDFAGPDTLIEQLKIHDGLLDIMRANGTRFSFPIKELDLRAFQKGIASEYTVAMDNAMPWGHISSTGKFGPLNAANLGETPASGNFSFSAVRLSDIGELHGTLNSSGSFRGPLGALEATGAAETRDFAVSDGTPTGLIGNIRCTVNGLTGEVVIHDVEVRSGATLAKASGGVVGSPKITNLDFAAQGRAQDALRPFVHSEVPIAGPLSLHGHAWVGPSQDGVRFLQRLRADGVFDVPAEIATDAVTEKRITQTSQHAQIHDDNPNADALMSLQGPAQIRDGIASSRHLTFRVAGAQATLGGTFNFHNQVVDLSGNLATQAGLSHAVTGFKSVLLKPLDPFFKKGKAGAMIPIRVAGGPGQYHVTQNLLHNK
jgi:AsmA-like C-terminal region